jgi:hypothetical protein
VYVGVLCYDTTIEVISFVSTWFNSNCVTSGLKAEPKTELNSAGKYSQDVGAENGPLETNGSQKPVTSLLAQAFFRCSSGSSPSVQVRAAFAQVGDLNWNWEKKILMSDYNGIPSLIIENGCYRLIVWGVL